MIKHAITIAILASSSTASIYDYTFTGTINQNGVGFTATFRVDTSIPPSTTDTGRSFWINLFDPEIAPIEHIEVEYAGNTFIMTREDMVPTDGMQIVDIWQNSGSQDRFNMSGVDNSANPSTIGVIFEGPRGMTSLTGPHLPTTSAELDVSTFERRDFGLNNIVGTVENVTVTLVPAPSTLATLAAALPLMHRRRRPA